MVALLIVLGFVLFLLLLSMLTAHAVLEYRDDVTLTLSILFLKFRLFPANGKKVRISDYSRKSAKKRKRKTSKTQKSEVSPQKSTEEKGILEKLEGLKKLLSILLKNTFGHLKIRTSRIRILVATGDDPEVDSPDGAEKPQRFANNELVIGNWRKFMSDYFMKRPNLEMPFLEKYMIQTVDDIDKVVSLQELDTIITKMKKDLGGSK